MLSLERNIHRQNRVLGVSLIDGMTIAFAVAAAMLTAAVFSLRKGLPPIEDFVRRARLEIVQDWAAVVGEPAPARPMPAASKANLLERLVASSSVAKGVNQDREELDRRWSARFDELTKADLNFWNRRSAELCQGAKVPDAPALTANIGAAPASFMPDLGKLATYRDQVWTQYDRCREESKVIIDENLLHFTYRESDLFDMTPDEVEHAKEVIRQRVDEHFKLGMRKVFVYGHCDMRGTRERNYPLSYGRAWYVARVMLDHLASKGLVEGKHFMLTPVGLGASRLLPCSGDGCTTEEYHRSCRRIELAFQKMTPADNKLLQELGQPPDPSRTP